jgi:hypothetical protein
MNAVKILVFLQGTVLMHRGAVGLSRDERVRRVRDGTDPSVRDFGSYVPVGNAIEQLRTWREQGAEIYNLSPHRKPENVARDEALLRELGFPPGPVLSRSADETYGAVAARLAPDVIVEDDCESIGAAEVTYTQIPLETRRKIKSIVVPEFAGLDHLPDRLADLRSV